MTFDDGIVTIYELTEKREPGKKPKVEASRIEAFCFGYDTLGINRYYTALQANQQIEAVVNIPGWNTIDSSKHIAAMEDGRQYRIQMVQTMLDEDGLRITKLSLERLGENYAVMSDTSDECPIDCYGQCRTL